MIIPMPYSCPARSSKRRISSISSYQLSSWLWLTSPAAALGALDAVLDALGAVLDGDFGVDTDLEDADLEDASAARLAVRAEVEGLEVALGVGVEVAIEILNCTT